MATALRAVADRGWVDVATGSYVDVAEDELDDFIGQLGQHAAKRGRSVD